MARAGVVAGLLALVAVASTAGEAGATFPGRNGDIVLSRFGDIYLLTAGGAERQLTFGPADDIAPTYSADGRTIIFSRDPFDRPRRLYVMRTDGTHPRMLNRAAWDARRA